MMCFLRDVLFPRFSMMCFFRDFPSCAFSERDSSKKCFWNKERSPARGLAWEAIVDSLNEIHSPKFQFKDKKDVRERWNLLRKKFSKMMSGERRQV